MAGILDPKKRIIDAIITVEGRRQLAKEEFEIAFATFSDEGTIYDSDDGLSARDISNLPVFEVVSLPRDTIIPEITDTGAFSLALADGNKIVNGRRVVSGSFAKVTVNEAGVRTVVQATPVLTGTLNVYSGSTDVMRTSKLHFDQLNIIGTEDGLVKSTFFTDKNTVRLSTEEIKLPMSSVKPLIFDDAVNLGVQSKYLPPRVKQSQGSSFLGHYPKLTSEPINNYESFKEEILDNSISKETIQMLSSGKNLNLLCQLFEINNQKTQKLVAIDYGNLKDQENNVYRIYFVGKPIRDLNGILKFCRLFTLVFEKGMNYE